MSIKQIPTGNIINGEEVIAIELTNNNGTYIKLYNYGAIINNFIIKNAKGNMQDIVLGFDDFNQYFGADYLDNNPHLGAVIGRYANRIKGASFQIDGQNFNLPKNNNSDTLHGGIDGFDKKVWDIVEFDEEISSVTLQYESIDGEEGFPGTLIVDLTLQLTENDELILSYEAETDKATAINLTHHGYFNLSPDGGKIDKHKQQIFAKNYLEQDDNYCVTGKLIPVKDTALDFTELKEFGKDWNPEEGYDQTYVLDKTYGDLTLASKTVEQESGLTLSIYTTEPVAHLYTSKYLKVKNGKGGKDYSGFEAFCVETQHHPNAVNIIEFPSTILRPGELYTQTTIYKVSTNK
ncbi:MULTISPECIES: aldose epimerase family protein [unclassified Pedobacter]|uniref:aldose epimerase family protein n=1 Tax=unclassified Pedobacter TaxID=2628915 RepID=UPI001E289ECE|nr:MULTISPECIES: aldose epimerase family protein [unclassified Pedobacter]